MFISPGVSADTLPVPSQRATILINVLLVSIVSATLITIALGDGYIH